jgi:hypothetical protein
LAFEVDRDEERGLGQEVCTVMVESMNDLVDGTPAGLAVHATQIVNGT